MLPNSEYVNNTIKENDQQKQQQQQRNHHHQPLCICSEKYKYGSRGRSSTTTNEEFNNKVSSYSRSVAKAEDKKDPTSDSYEKPNATLLQNSKLEQGYQIMLYIQLFS